MSQEIKTDLGCRPELKWVPVDLIDIDHNYQRELRPARIRQILSEFDWKMFGTVMLVAQPNGRYTAFDGQHRTEVARLHPLITEVPAAVYQVEDMREEAEAFLGVNINRTAVSTVERFWAGLEAADTDMLSVSRALKKAGCDVIQAHGVGSKSTNTSAVTAVSRAIKLYGEPAVSSSCRVISTAWPSDAGALTGILIQAVARLFRNNPDIDDVRLREIFAKRHRQQLTADAEAIRKIAGGAAEVALAKTIVELYNKNLSKNTISFGVRP